MNTKKLTTGVAILGVLAGAGGLAAVTVPAGADAAPELPKTSPDALVNSVLTAKPAQFGGTVSATSDLGIPLPKLAAGTDGNYNAQVYYDGKNRFRSTTTEQGGAKQTTVADGNTVWNYDSAKRTANKAAIPDKAKNDTANGAERKSNPAAVGKQLVGKLRQSSELAVNGTAEVAGRDAYELVLTPKASEKTLVREVRVAVDAQTRIPLRFEVFGNGSTKPALEAGFSKISMGKQDPALFSFTPPAGAKVVTVDPRKHMDAKSKKAAADTKRVGDGWDSVYTGKFDAKQAMAPKGGANKRANGNTPNQIIDRFAKPVHGSFGDGRLVSTSIGTALLTNDGRFAAGFVPQQVLEQALEAK